MKVPPLLVASFLPRIFNIPHSSPLSSSSLIPNSYTRKAFPPSPTLHIRPFKNFKRETSPPQKRTRNPIRLCSKRCVGVSPSFFSDSRSVEGLSSIVLPIEQPSVSPFFSSSSLLTAKYVFWWGRIWFSGFFPFISGLF